jgi:hypothetical protein
MSSTFYTPYQVNKRKEEFDAAAAHAAEQIEQYSKFMDLYPYSVAFKLEGWRFQLVFNQCDYDFVTFEKRGRWFTATVFNPMNQKIVYSFTRYIPREENAVDNALQSLEGTINKAIEAAKKE